MFKYTDKQKICILKIVINLYFHSSPSYIYMHITKEKRNFRTYGIPFVILFIK